MGLIARAIEAQGISTVAISITKELTLSVGVPRAVFLRWPLGHPLGEPHQRAQQQTVIYHALQTLLEASEPDTLVEPALRWRRETYVEPDWSKLVQ
ncbi:MAG: hypothetical protein WDZ49_10620 [Litorilinea sp.]